MENSNNRSFRTKIIILLFLVLAAILSIVLFSRFGNQSRELVSTGDMFINAIIDQDSATSYSLMSERAKQSWGSEKNWSDFANSWFQGLDNSKLLEETPLEETEQGQEFGIGDYDTSEQPTILVYEVQYQDSTSSTLPIIFVYENGQWKYDRAFE